MAQYESSVKYVSATQEQVYAALEDLNHLSYVKEQLSLLQEKLGDKIKDMQFDRDSMTINVQGIPLTLKIVEREPYKCIKFAGEKSPIPLNVWIQMLPVDAAQAKLKVTLRAELNFMFKKMLEKPLKEGVEKLADMLSVLNYNQFT